MFVQGKVSVGLHARGGQERPCGGGGRKQGLLLSPPSSASGSEKSSTSPTLSTGNSVLSTLLPPDDLQHHQNGLSSTSLSASSLSVVGGIRKYAVEVSSIVKLANRFAEDGKLSLTISSGDQIYLSHAMSSHIFDLVTALLRINPKISLAVPRNTAVPKTSPRAHPRQPLIMSHRPINAQKAEMAAATAARHTATRKRQSPEYPAALLPSKRHSKPRMHDTAKPLASEEAPTIACEGVVGQQALSDCPTLDGDTTRPDEHRQLGSEEEHRTRRTVCSNDTTGSGGASANPPKSFLDRVPRDVLPLIVMRCPNSALAVCKEFAECVQKFRTKLKFLPKRGFNVPCEVICRTIQRSPNLRILDLSGCSELTPGALGQLAMAPRLPRRLTTLIFRGCFRLTDPPVRKILFRLRGVEVLDLLDCTNVTHLGLRPARLYKNLRRLLVGSSAPSQCTSTGGRGALHLNAHELLLMLLGKMSKFSDTPLPTSGSLDVDCSRDEEAHVAERLSQLAVLSPSTSTVIEPLPKIELLVLANFIRLRDLSPIVNIGSTLTYLDIRGCTSIDDSIAPTFKHLTSLKSLNLADTSVGDEVILQVVRSCSSIEALDCGRLQGNALTSQAVETLTSPPYGLRQLKRLKITHSSAMEDRGLRSILMNSPWLEFLDVCGCWLLTNSSLEDPTAAVAARGRLREVGIHACSLDRVRVERQLARLILLPEKLNSHSTPGTGGKRGIWSLLSDGGMVGNQRKVSLPKVFDSRELTCIPLVSPASL